MVVSTIEIAFVLADQFGQLFGHQIDRIGIASLVAASAEHDLRLAAVLASAAVRNPASTMLSSTSSTLAMARFALRVGA